MSLPIPQLRLGLRLRLLQSPSPFLVSNSRQLSRPATLLPTPPPHYIHTKSFSRLPPLHPPASIHPRRSISTSAKSYLYTESLQALRLLTFGSLGLLISGSILYLGLHYYLEMQSPTPKIYDLPTRSALHSAYHAKEWEGDLARAVGFLNEAVERIEEVVAQRGGWEAVRVLGEEGWEEGMRRYVKALGELGELEEKLGYRRRAAGRWRKILEFCGEGSPLRGCVGTGERVRAAVRLGGLLDEVGDVEGISGGVEVEGNEDEMSRRREKREKEAEEKFKFAYLLAAEDAGVDTRLARETPGVIPAGEKLSRDLLDTATELGIHYARFRRLDKALPIFLSLLRARSSVSPTKATTTRGEIADPCEIGKVEAYLGEVLWAVGERRQGVEMEKRALETVERLVEERAGCRDCAVFAGGNLVVMLRKLLEEVERGNAEEGKKVGGGLWLWKRRDEGMGEKGVGELEREVEEAEDMLRGVLGVRVTKGK
ncbi:hypothetical protein BGX38DRAFT_1333355 [Terfezia claveryi]|nr:hypothetical protein BGX38DRAFT_1333355 [Terfezia claveryi]